MHVWIQGGGVGTGSADPPGKSQVLWVSILEKVEPPCPWKMLDPL